MARSRVCGWLDEDAHRGNLSRDAGDGKAVLSVASPIPFTQSSLRGIVSAEQNLTRTRIATALSLVAIGVVQWNAARTLRNDAFVDEATYIVSGQLLRTAHASGIAAPPVANYLSGAPHLYPQLASLLFERGGLEAARTFSLFCMLAALVAVYSAARGIFDRRLAGVAAAALFSTQAPVLFLSRFATYDALCVALLAIALAFAVDSRARWRTATAVAAGLCIGTAAVVKYAALLYLPCIVLVAAFSVPSLSLFSSARLTRGAIAAAAALTVAGLLVSLGEPSRLLTGFVTTTLTRAVTSGGRAIDLLLFASALGGVSALLALPAMAIASSARRFTSITIFVWALLAPLNHVRLHEFVSLHKHMAFALVLFTVLAGGTIAALMSWIRRRWEYDQLLIAFAVAAASLAICARAIVRPGQTEADRLFRYWPNNTSYAYRAIAPVLRSDAHYLAEEPDLGTLYLGTRAPVSQWVHPYFFDYDGQRARTPSDLAPFRSAIRDGYFTAIVLRFGPQRTWANAMEEALLRSQPRYRLAARLPFELADGPGAYQVWVRSDAPGAGQVR